jgi:uncharacterized FlgJ-related protein
MTTMTNEEIGSLIYATAFADGMPAYLCSLIESQARHETDDFSSHAFLLNNNCFGYKYVKGGKWQQGAGIISTEDDPYAKYDSVENSVHELCSWIKRRQKDKRFPADLTKVDSTFEYASLLKECGYYGDSLSHYVQGLNHFMKN